MSDNTRTDIVLYLLGGVVVILLSLLIAPDISGGLAQIVSNLPKRINQPYSIELCEDSMKTVLIFLAIYILGISMHIVSKKNYKRGKEYGSAVWGIPRKVNRKYKQFPKKENKLLTKNVKIGFKAKKHKRNLNVLVVGGSGAGKTRCYGKPNIMQCNCSYVILDPKRRDFKGYRIFTRKRGI